MLKIAGEEVQTKAMDHHGLVATICKDLGIARRIDEKLGKRDKQRIVSPGQAVVAMILNGPRFTKRRLYLTHQFFETKPVEMLLGAPIQAKDLTDYTLGHALDEIANYGSSQLFGEVAFAVALENNLLGNINHLDTTSLSVQGEYEVENKATVIEITHGYSKDHRPDLKQVVLSLVDKRTKNHINDIEGFWSYAKHILYNYRGVSKYHFPLYLKEIEYRFNHRRENLFKNFMKVYFGYISP